MISGDPPASGYFLPHQEVVERLSQIPDYRVVTELLQDGDTLEEQATGGNREAMLRLALAYAYGDGVPQSDTECVAWLRKSTEAGLPLAMLVLGAMHFAGRGVGCSYETGIDWLKRAAEAGNDEAKFRLGLAYDDGLAPARNRKPSSHRRQSVAGLPEHLLQHLSQARQHREITLPRHQSNSPVQTYKPPSN